ncbi:MAG: respiratory nitrate reductase subunit gamma, partial [Chloroflexota bacterium]|nr:respiratory nitrate reductase subunit gamma [Chloroflexota bacterium]
MNSANSFLWIVIPYVATAIFVAGHIWRYRRDQFGWTCRSTQVLESRWLAWGSILFHYGALAAIAGHVLGILVPVSVTDALHISEQYYHIVSAGGGSVASVAVLAGL